MEPADAGAQLVDIGRRRRRPSRPARRPTAAGGVARKQSSGPNGVRNAGEPLPGSSRSRTSAGAIDAVVAPELAVARRAAEEMERALPDGEVGRLKLVAPRDLGRGRDAVVDPEVQETPVTGPGEVELVGEDRGIEARARPEKAPGRRSVMRTAVSARSGPAGPGASPPAGTLSPTEADFERVRESFLLRSRLRTVRERRAQGDKRARKGPRRGARRGPSCGRSGKEPDLGVACAGLKHP